MKVGNVFLWPLEVCLIWKVAELSGYYGWEVTVLRGYWRNPGRAAFIEKWSWSFSEIESNDI